MSDDRAERVSRRGVKRTLYSPTADRSGISIVWRGDGWLVGGWYDTMVGIEECLVTQEDLEWLKGRSK